jgi:hypothetical protein
MEVVLLILLKQGSEETDAIDQQFGDDAEGQWQIQCHYTVAS